MEKSRRTISDGSLQTQTYLSALFSCQRTIRLLSACINLFLVNRLIQNGKLRSKRNRKEGSAYMKRSADITYSIFMSNSNIIFIMASLIRPFNSISTAIYTFPYSSYNGRIQLFIYTGHRNLRFYQWKLCRRP